MPIKTANLLSLLSFGSHVAQHTVFPFANVVPIESVPATAVHSCPGSCVAAVCTRLKLNTRLNKWLRLARRCHEVYRPNGKLGCLAEAPLLLAVRGLGTLQQRK